MSISEAAGRGEARAGREGCLADPWRVRPTVYQLVGRRRWRGPSGKIIISVPGMFMCTLWRTHVTEDPLVHGNSHNEQYWKSTAIVLQIHLNVGVYAVNYRF